MVAILLLLAHVKGGARTHAESVCPYTHQLDVGLNLPSGVTSPHHSKPIDRRSTEGGTRAHETSLVMLNARHALRLLVAIQSLRSYAQSRFATLIFTSFTMELDIVRLRIDVTEILQMLHKSPGLRMTVCILQYPWYFTFRSITALVGEFSHICCSCNVHNTYLRLHSAFVY